MKFLLDHCVPRHLIFHLTGFDVSRSDKLGLAGLTNGKLLAAAESLGFHGLITVDKGFVHQQSFVERTISVLLMESRKTDFGQPSGILARSSGANGAAPLRTGDQDSAFTSP